MAAHSKKRPKGDGRREPPPLEMQGPMDGRAFLPGETSYGGDEKWTEPLR